MRSERDARLDTTCQRVLLEGCFGFQDRVDMAGSSPQLCKASPGFGRVRSGLIGSDRVSIEPALHLINIAASMWKGALVHIDLVKRPRRSYALLLFLESCWWYRRIPELNGSLVLLYPKVMHTQSPKSRNSTPTYVLSPSPSNQCPTKFPHNRARWAHKISQHTPTTIPTPQADFRHSSSYDIYLLFSQTPRLTALLSILVLNAPPCIAISSFTSASASSFLQLIAGSVSLPFSNNVGIASESSLLLVEVVEM